MAQSWPDIFQDPELSSMFSPEKLGWFDLYPLGDGQVRAVPFREVGRGSVSSVKHAPRFDD